MTQIGIVYIIGISLAAWLVYKLLRTIFRKDKRNYCRSCPMSKECKRKKL